MSSRSLRTGRSFASRGRPGQRVRLTPNDSNYGAPPSNVTRSRPTRPSHRARLALAGSRQPQARFTPSALYAARHRVRFRGRSWRLAPDRAQRPLSCRRRSARRGHGYGPSRSTCHRRSARHGHGYGPSRSTWHCRSARRALDRALDSGLNALLDEDLGGRRCWWAAFSLHW